MQLLINNLGSRNILVLFYHTAQQVILYNVQLGLGLIKINFVVHCLDL